MRLSFVVSLLCLGLVPAAAVADEAPADMWSTGMSAAAPSSDSGVIVRFRPGVDADERRDTRDDADVRREAILPLAGAELVTPEAGVDTDTAIRALERDPDVLYAEENARRTAFATPSDTNFGLQWGLRNTGQPVAGTSGTPGADIDAPAAWDLTTGSAGVVVGVIDSGADTTHPDLVPNLWRNPGEAGAQATDRVDNDRNGYVDDVNGWDFAGRDAQPVDGNGHGSHVAGTVAAKGNNGAGVTGVAWSSSLMVLRALDDAGSGTVADAITAYAYAARNGARVVNLSFGGSSSSLAERDAMAAAGGVLFVAAAGNDGANNDVTDSFPCNYELANVVCVGASDRNDALASFSNRGREKVDLAAPGVQIASTWKGGGYQYSSGTSMAAPHVTGVAALALARTPRLTVAQLRQVLLTSVDPVPALAGVTVTGGRLNAVRALQAAVSPGGVFPGSPTTPTPPPATPVTPTAAPATSAPVVPAPAPVVPAPAPVVPASAPVVAAPAPQAPTAPVTPPVRALDRTAPVLLLSASRAVRSPTVRTRGLRATITCSEACRLSVTLTVDTATARKLHLRSRRIGTATATLTKAGTRVVTLRLTAAARSRLRGRGKVVLRATASDAAGNRRVGTRTVALRP